MASRRSRRIGAAAEQLIGERRDDVRAGDVAVVSEGHYRVLFDRAPLPYIVSDFLGVIRAANRAAAILLKRPAELLEGKPLSVFVPLEYRAEFRETLAGLPLLDGLRDWRITLVPHAGAAADVSMHATVLHGAWEGHDAIFWLVRPRRRDPAD